MKLMKYRSLLVAILIVPLMAFECHDYCDSWKSHIDRGGADGLYAQEVKNRCVMRAVRSLDAVRYFYMNSGWPFRTGDYTFDANGEKFGPVKCVASPDDTTFTFMDCIIRHISGSPETWQVDFSGCVGTEGFHYDFSMDAEHTEEVIPDDPAEPDGSGSEFYDRVWINEGVCNLWKVNFSGKKTEDSDYQMEFRSDGQALAGWVYADDRYGRLQTRIAMDGAVDITFFKGESILDRYRFVYSPNNTDAPGEDDLY